MPRLTHAQIAQLGRDYLAAKAEEQAAGDRRREIGHQLLGALARKDVDTLTVLGVRITRKASSRAHYGVDQVKARLGRRAKPFLIQAVDSTALRKAATAGDISQEDLAGCVATVTTSKPYVDVTDLDVDDG